jgi:hypothetical protein
VRCDKAQLLPYECSCLPNLIYRSNLRQRALGATFRSSVWSHTILLDLIVRVVNISRLLVGGRIRERELSRAFGKVKLAEYLEIYLTVKILHQGSTRPIVGSCRHQPAVNLSKRSIS